MSDITDIEARYAQTAPEQMRAVIEGRRAVRRARWGQALLGTIAFAQLLVILAMLPLQRIQPVFVYLSEVGTWTTDTALSALPPDTRQAGIAAVAWEYVRRREHYSLSEADEDYRIVSAMSAANVREQYQAWANPGKNREAPANLLGKGGSIRVYRITGRFIAQSEDRTSGRYEAVFCRVVRGPAGVTAQRTTAVVGYTLIESIPLWLRLTVNPIGWMATDYPSPEPIGAPIRVHTGQEENPCRG